MAKLKEIAPDFKLSERATLNMLVALEDEGVVSQRGLAERLGVALGFTNTLVKRAIRKGLVKVSQVPAKRYAYYVTPKGFGEKSRLVADYLSSSLDFFRIARSQYVETFRAISLRGVKEVYLYRAGELAEIALLSAQEVGLKISGIIEPGANYSELHGVPVLPDIDQAEKEKAVAIVITDVESPQKTYEQLIAHVSDDLIYAVSFLHVTRQKSEEEET